MKLSKSKLALAKVINENGGWHSNEHWLFSTQSGDGVLKFWKTKPKAQMGCVCTEWSGGCRLNFALSRAIQNWHQTILSRAEYYQAYPKSGDDGWIEYDGKGSPYSNDDVVEAKWSDGELTCSNEFGPGPAWIVESHRPNITHHRLHRPAADAECCKSVARSIPEPDVEAAKSRLAKNLGLNVDVKPTIEQLAQDYRNAKDYADRLQKEADDACTRAGSILGQIERAGEEIGFIMNPISDDKKITESSGDWRKLKIGDVIWVGECDDCTEGNYTVIRTEPHDYEFEHAVEIRLTDGDTMWINVTKPWKPISRP